MLETSKKSFICPKPIPNKYNNYISNLNNKKFMIVSFLNGKSKVIYLHQNVKLLVRNCKVSSNNKNFKFIRKNDLSVRSWRSIFTQVKDRCNKIHADLPKLIEANLISIEREWPKNLPSGIIHADLFSDNIFLK